MEIMILLLLFVSTERRHHSFSINIPSSCTVVFTYSHCFIRLQNYSAFTVLYKSNATRFRCSENCENNISQRDFTVRFRLMIDSNETNVIFEQFMHQYDPMHGLITVRTVYAKHKNRL